MQILKQFYEEVNRRMVGVKCQFPWTILWWYVAETVKIIHFCLEIDSATVRLTFLVFSKLVIKINLGNSKGSNFTSKFHYSAEHDEWGLPNVVLKSFFGRYCYLLQWVAQSKNGTIFISEFYISWILLSSFESLNKYLWVQWFKNHIWAFQLTSF